MTVKNLNIMANSVDPDEMAHYEPSHLDLQCLLRYMVWPTGLKWLRNGAIPVSSFMSEELLLLSSYFKGT